MTVLVDGFTTGLTAAIWTAGLTLGLLTALAPWAAGGWLIWRLTSTIRTTRAAWWLRARRSIRRSARP
jgi:hypothetical protein